MTLDESRGQGEGRDRSEVPDPTGSPGPSPEEAEPEGAAAGEAPPGGAAGKPPTRRRWLRWAWRSSAAIIAIVALLTPLVVWEARTSGLQAWLIAPIAAELDYTVGAGPSPNIHFPSQGPLDRRLGYTRIPEFFRALAPRGFDLVEQARMSSRQLELLEQGVFTIYPEKLQGGLYLRDRRGDPLHAAPNPARVYETFDSIPELLLYSLLFIESRDLLDPRYPNRNPAVEWDRLVRSAFELVLSRPGSERNVPGGSTLATQLEKFRHAPEGLTASPRAKLLQMASASLRAYLEGPETLDAQRRIILAYVNSVPLAAQRGHGEVTGTADGLWAWYGTDFDTANSLVRNHAATDADVGARARVFRQVLSLLIAQRRPSYYLSQDAGRRDLAELVSQYLRLLAREGVITAELTVQALHVDIDVLDRAPPLPPPSFVSHKAADQVRTHLLGLLQVPSLYDLDRFDMSARSTLDVTWRHAVSEVLLSMSDPVFLRDHGFASARLLARGDPGLVVYAFTLLERTPVGNVVRVQTDTYDGPLNVSQSARLELGPTAKLRTLVTYLEVVEELHSRLSGLPVDSLRGMSVPAQDRLTRWVVDHLVRSRGADLTATLQAAMERTYSASPAERFATGGGVQTFSNFDARNNGRVMSVGAAFQQSVNLVSIRTMRDIVQYHVYRDPETTERIFGNADDPVREEYLSRFADDEGRRFLRRFYAKYEGRPAPELLDLLVSERSLSPQRVAWAFRTVALEATVERFEEFLLTHTPFDALSPGTVEDLYVRSDPAPHPIQDLGYLARIHPLELWLVAYLMEHPGAGLSEVLAESTQVRQDVYQWLFRTRRRTAQDSRIRTMLELEAFDAILARWRRVGYPFQNIVPSYGTAIGSSGDRPLALAELLGIIVNDDVRYPVVLIEETVFGEGTPFETRFRNRPAEGSRVMSSEVAVALREALIDVVANGTGRRALGSFTGPDGQPLVIGGKTGTGDNRYRVYAPGGRLLETRVVNRTATFAFFAGDRYFGVVTAHVPGPDDPVAVGEGSGPDSDDAAGRPPPL